MRKKVAQWIGGTVLSMIAVLIYLILFQTYLFSTTIIKNLNKYYLSTVNMSLSGQINGGLLANNLGIADLRILVNSGRDTLFTEKNIALDNWEYSWDNKEILLDGISLKRFTLNSQHLKSIVLSPKKKSSSGSLIINQIRAEQGVLVLTDSTTHVELEKLHADLWMIDGLFGVSLKNADISSPELLEDTLHLAAIIGRDLAGTTKIENLQISCPAFSSEMDIELTKQELNAHVKGINIPIAELLKLKLPQNYVGLSLNFSADINKDHDLVTLSSFGSIELNGKTFPFDLTSFEKSPRGENLTLQLGTEFRNAKFTASRDSLGTLKAFADIFRFDITPLVKLSKINIQDPIGQIEIEGSSEQLDIDARFESFAINDLLFDSLNTTLQILPNKHVTFSKSTVNLANNTLMFSGDIQDKKLNIKGNVDLNDFGFIPVSNPKNKLHGGIYGDFALTGSFSQPHIIGEIIPDSMGIGTKVTLSGLGKVDLLFKQTGMDGDIALMGTEGLFFGDSLESYTVLANMSNNKYEIEELHFQGKHNLLSLKGRSSPSVFELDKLHLINGPNQFKLIDSVKVHRIAGGTYQVPESILTFNRGGIALRGGYTQNQGLDLQVDYELIDIAEIMEFLGLNLEFAGVANGSGTITGPLNDPVFNAQVELLNGVSLGYPSDSAKVDITLTSSAAIGNRIQAFKDGGSLVLVGQLPWGYKVKSKQIYDTPQNFSINLDNYQLCDLKFTSIIDLPVSGRASGVLAIRGTPGRTKLDGQLEITSAKFDTLSFTRAYSEFLYEDNLLTFDSLSMMSTWGYGHGSGFLPISLDMIAQDRMAVAKRDMGLDFDFNLNEMPFLTSYISTIDAINGDFIGKMTFTGPMTAPIRNGKIRGHNGSLAVSVLGNPIFDIHSEITLTDNTMTIDHFSGRMQFSEGSSLNSQGLLGKATTLVSDLIGVNTAQEYAGTLSATGTIDLSSFFRPRFDINLDAKEVYYRSTDGLIEAIADASLQFTGQDTLDVTAIIPVQRAVYYASFEIVEPYQETISQVDDLVFRYSLETQYPSDLVISNDQMEAEFEGELWLLDYGDGIMRFSGTLTALEGGKFFYLGNELTIVTGEIIFNSVDFNPQLNMEAAIDINGERVSLLLTGDMNEPELAIRQVDNTKLTQTDVLTYLTINQTMVEVSFDAQSALNPVGSYTEMLIDKQVSKIVRDISGLDILDISGLDILDMNANTDSTVIPSFELGHRLSKNLKVTGGLQPTTDQTGYDFGFEYQINRNVSVTSRINQDLEVELNGRIKFTY